MAPAAVAAAVTVTVTVTATVTAPATPITAQLKRWPAGVGFGQLGALVSPAGWTSAAFVVFAVLFVACLRPAYQ